MDLTIPEYFKKELRIFNPDLGIRWNQDVKRFEIMERLRKPLDFDRPMEWWETPEWDYHKWAHVMYIETEEQEFRYPSRTDFQTLKSRWLGRFPNDGREAERVIREMRERHNANLARYRQSKSAELLETGARIWDVVHGTTRVSVPAYRWH